MRDRKLVEEAQSLQKSGLKVWEIANKLDQSTSNINRWCRKANFTLNQPQNQSEDINRWLRCDQINRTLSSNESMLLLSTLYWCEGCKYPGSNRVEFVSSDENMQLTFITLFRKVFPLAINEEKFRVMLQLHSTHNINKQISYWSKLLNIPVNQFIKPHITEGKNSRYRISYNGTCSIRYHDYRLLLRMMGMYSQIGKFFSYC